MYNLSFRGVKCMLSNSKQLKCIRKMKVQKFMKKDAILSNNWINFDKSSKRWRHKNLIHIKKKMKRRKFISSNSNQHMKNARLWLKLETRIKQSIIWRWKYCEMKKMLSNWKLIKRRVQLWKMLEIEIWMIVWFRKMSNLIVNWKD